MNCKECGEEIPKENIEKQGDAKFVHCPNCGEEYAISRDFSRNGGARIRRRATGGLDVPGECTLPTDPLHDLRSFGVHPRSHG